MSEKSEIAIRADGLVKRFGAFTAVDGVSFDVERGTLFSLLGVNGAGKTTTIRLLTGLLRPDGGHAEICGYPAGSTDAARLIGLSPQETSTAGNLTVRENLINQVSGNGRGGLPALHRHPHAHRPAHRRRPDPCGP